MGQRKIAVLVNPKAGRGRALRRLSDFEDLAIRHGLAFEIWKTEYSGHAQILAAKAVEQGIDRLVVIGGDGTISDVADRLAGRDISLGIIPGGTGNDVARSIGITSDGISQAFKKILTGDTIKVDIGYEHFSKRSFASFAGCGFPAIVAARANKMKVLKSRFVFFVSLYAVVRQMEDFPVTIDIDGDRREIICTSIMVQNTPYTGGGLKVAPGAVLDDGLLDVIIVGKIGTIELMKNFPKLYSGKHLSHPAFQVVQGRRIKIDLPDKQMVSFDGETDFTDKLDIEINSKAVKLIV